MRISFGAWIAAGLATAATLVATTAWADGPRAPARPDQWVRFGRSASGPPAEIWYNKYWLILGNTDDGEPFVALPVVLAYDSEQSSVVRKRILADGQADNGGRYFQLSFEAKIFCTRRVYIDASLDTYLDAKGNRLFFVGDANQSVHPALPIENGTALDLIRQSFCPK